MTAIGSHNVDAEGLVESLKAKLAEAEERLAEAHEVINAIRSGDVDAVVVSGSAGEQVFTLRGAEYSYRVLVEAMNEGAATLGSDGTVLYCNRRFSELMGISQEQVIGRGFASMARGDSADALKALFSRALKEGEAKSEIKWVAASGRTLPTQVSLSRIQADDPISVCMVVTDLTESKKWEEMVSAGELASSILESSAEGIAVCDETGKIVSANEALRRLLGTNPIFEDFDTAFCLEVEHAGSPTRFTVHSAMNGEIRAQEVRYRREDGLVYSLLVSSGRISGNSGVAGCVLTLTDITQEKRTEQALRTTERLASVGRMAATVAHEINNPLEAVTNLVFLAKANAGRADVTRYLDAIEEELIRISHITRQTLGFYRESTAPSAIRIGTMLDPIISVFSGRARNRRIEIRSEIRHDPEIYAVAGEIRQVIANLLSNGIDAVNSDGDIRIRVGAALLKDASSSGVRITIADSGPGIPPSVRPKLFEPFFTTKKDVGTGLGLWVCKNIVERHHGSIRVKSSTTIGRSWTVFSIFLPSSCPTSSNT